MLRHSVRSWSRVRVRVRAGVRARVRAKACGIVYRNFQILKAFSLKGEIKLDQG